MKYCLIKQDVYQDLYVSSNDTSPSDMLFSSMMRVGPFGLINDLSADFFIIKEENTEECQIYNHFLRGFGGNYKLLKTQPLNSIPGNEFFEPGTDKANGFFSVNAEDINWSLYDIVISINFTLPTNIIKLHKNTLWCYLIGENNRHLLDDPKYGYDIALNQDVTDQEPNLNNNVILFPYTFLNDNTLYNVMNNYLRMDKKGGVFVEINSCRGRPVTSYPDLFDKISDKFKLPVLIHKQNIKENLINLYNAKYFVKHGGRDIRGNSVIEAISSSTLVLMGPRSCGYGFLIGNDCRATSEEEIMQKIEYFENNPEKYTEAMSIQKRLLKKHCFYKPLEHIENKWINKANKAVVFVANLPYFGNFITTLIQLHDVGKYQGPVVLIAGDDLYNTDHLNNNPNIKKYNVTVINFKNIEKTLNEETKNKIVEYYTAGGKKNYNWGFGCFNKFYLFNKYFKQFKYILYLDTGVKIYRPIWDMFLLAKKGKILAHHDDFPKYHWSLSDKFRNIEPYISDLSKEFDIKTKHYFQTTIMLYDTSIINDDTFDNIIKLVEKYPMSQNGDQEYISLYFHQVTKQMEQITIKKNDNYYYYDYYQRYGVNKYCMTKI